jgi:hypothetical protein
MWSITLGNKLLTWWFTLLTLYMLLLTTSLFLPNNNSKVIIFPEALTNSTRMTLPRISSLIFIRAVQIFLLFLNAELY